MALTAAQVASVRRYTGVPVGGSPESLALAAVLAALTPEEEAVVTATFLPQLTKLEQGMLDSASAMDTAKAAVWERNANELQERAALYVHARRALCHFLGVTPGPGVAELPPFTVCCPKGGSTGTGGTVVPVDPATGQVFTPAVFVV